MDNAENAHCPATQQSQAPGGVVQFPVQQSQVGAIDSSQVDVNQREAESVTEGIQARPEGSKTGTNVQPGAVRCKKIKKMTTRPAPASPSRASRISASVALESPSRRSPRLIPPAVTIELDVVEVEEPVPKAHTGRGRRGPSLLHPRTAKLGINHEELQNDTKGKICCRCNPKDVIDAIGALSDAQREKLDSMGWGTFLKMTIDAVESRELFLWLLSRVDVNNMLLKVSPEKVLPLKKEAVNIVLGIPPGTHKPPKKPQKEVTASKRDLATALGCTEKQLTIDRLKDELKKGHDDELSIRCFFLIVFNRLLFSTTSWIISNSEIELTMDFTRFTEVDWQQAILDHIKISADHWQRLGDQATNPSMSACAPLLLIYYLDNLDHPLNNGSRQTVPRAAQFIRRKIEMLAGADKCTDPSGLVTYGKLKLKDPSGSAYEGAIPQFMDSSTSATVDHFVMPSMSNLLSDVVGRLSADNSIQIANLASAFDEGIQQNQLAVQHHQQSMQHLQQANKDLILKFADDVKNLLHRKGSSNNGVARPPGSNTHIFGMSINCANHAGEPTTNASGCGEWTARDSRTALMLEAMAGHRTTIELLRNHRKLLSKIPADIRPTKVDNQRQKARVSVEASHTPTDQSAPAQPEVEPQISVDEEIHYDESQPFSSFREGTTSTMQQPRRRIKMLNPAPPPRSKDRGDRNNNTDVKTLGAKGPKLCTRNCSFCHLAVGHNTASCPENPKNFERLKKLQQPPRKRGRPSARGKGKMSGPVNTSSSRNFPVFGEQVENEWDQSGESETEASDDHEDYSM